MDKFKAGDVVFNEGLGGMKVFYIAELEEGGMVCKILIGNNSWITGESFYININSFIGKKLAPQTAELFSLLYI